MINSELLKEAIADAKAVRATALANAKAALEEAFAPRFEAMFADKLKEESEEEEEGLQEVEAPNQVSGKGGEAKGPATKAVSKGQPRTPKGGAGDTDFKAVQVGLGPKDVPKLGKKVNETAEEEEEGKDLDEVAEEEEEGKVEEGLTSEDLDEIIRELENEVAEEEEGKREEPAAPAPAPEEDEEEPAPEGGVPPAPVAGGEEDAAVSAAPGSEVDINLGPEAGAEAGGVPPAPGMNAGGLEQPQLGPDGQPLPPQMGMPGQMPGKMGMPGQMPGQVPPQPGDEDDENINLEELLAALNEESEEEEEEGVDESLQNNGIPTNELAGQDKGGGVKGYPTAPQDASKHQIKGKNHNISGPGRIANHGAPAALGKPVNEVSQYKVALREAYKTIEFLRGQINEVNLLNAKLLYTNKLFKEFAGVLDDPYRMKIVESFDLTKSVREVKLAYALLAESLNFGTHMIRTPAKQIVKSAPAKGQIKQITEGFASKPVSSTRPSQLITEGNEMALRFKKLAGIKEAPKTSEKK